MEMEMLYSLLPDLAEEETRYVTVNGHSQLPDGTYAFMESYCNDPACDCRRVFVSVIARQRKPVLATISFGWETKAFYRRWMHGDDFGEQLAGATLAPLTAQSRHAEAILEMFQTVVCDPAYVARLERHYHLFKKAVKDRAKRAPREPAPAVPPELARGSGTVGDPSASQAGGVRPRRGAPRFLRRRAKHRFRH